MLYKGTILEHWSNNTFQLCHKWDHRSCLITKISHTFTLTRANTLIIVEYFTPGVSTKISSLKKRKQTWIYKNLYFSFSSFPSTAQIILNPQRELFLADSSWTKWKRLPAECRWRSLRFAFMQGSDLDVFDVRLEQHMPAWWQVGWNVLRSLAPQHQGDHKVRTEWSSTPGGRFQEALPAAPQPWSLCWIVNSLDGWSWSSCNFLNAS